MNPASIDIKDILDADSSLGLIFQTDLFVAEMPTTPDLCVVVYDSPGDDPEVNYTYERPHVQVQVRGDRGDYKAAHELAQAVRNTLNGLANHTINSTRYVGIWNIGDIMPLGFDESQRPLLSVNFRIHRTSV